MNFPLIRRIRCSPDKPHVACSDRHRAQVAGSFWWDAERGGWCWADIPKRRASSWKAKYFCGDHTGEPYLIEACPYCGVPLPDVRAIADATCSDGEGGE